jgi:tetratricopeptide (TPR) repeat protein
VSLPASRWQAANQPAFQAASFEGIIGQGVLLGIFGGFRSIMADFAWLRSYIHWGRHDRASCETFMRTATALDPGNILFWTGAIDRIGYDMPRWEIDEREHGGQLQVDKAVQAQITREHVERALNLAAQGAKQHPQHASDFWMRSGHLCRLKLRNYEQAALFFKRAAEGDPPLWFASLSYVNALCELGREVEARLWLREEIKRRQARNTPDPQDILGILKERLEELEKQRFNLSLPPTL